MCDYVRVGWERGGNGGNKGEKVTEITTGGFCLRREREKVRGEGREKGGKESSCICVFIRLNRNHPLTTIPPYHTTPHHRHVWVCGCVGECGGGGWIVMVIVLEKRVPNPQEKGTKEERKRVKGEREREKKGELGMKRKEKSKER